MDQCAMPINVVQCAIFITSRGRGNRNVLDQCLESDRTLSHIVRDFKLIHHVLITVLLR